MRLFASSRFKVKYMSVPWKDTAFMYTRGFHCALLVICRGFTKHISPSKIPIKKLSSTTQCRLRQSYVRLEDQWNLVPSRLYLRVSQPNLNPKRLPCWACRLHSWNHCKRSNVRAESTASKAQVMFGEGKASLLGGRLHLRANKVGLIWGSHGLGDGVDPDIVESRLNLL